MDIKNRKLTMDDFMRERAEALATWPTGAEAENLDESFAWQSAIPDSKRFSTAIGKAMAERATLVQPRAGVCLLKNHIQLLKRLQNEGGADLLPTTIDSYTRQNRYAEAKRGIDESMTGERSLLNGFPAVNYGVNICREVTAALDRPVQIRHGTPDARLLAEISIAGGFTAFEGGGISYNIPYAKNVPLEQSIAAWQYVDRLVGLYAEHGIIINREPFGPLTGTMVPPSISNTIAIIEALLAAEQGVLDLTVGYGQCGNLHQDIAAINALRKQGRQYLDTAGFTKVTLSTVFHQWMGGFPPDEAQSFGVIAWGAAAAALSGATKVISKTPHEAFGVPTTEANIQGVKATRQILNMLRGQQPLESDTIRENEALIMRETEALIENTMRLGEGDLAQGVFRAFKAGVLDIPFAPSRAARGAVVPVRDLYGAVRFFDFGNLPFDEEIKNFHRRALTERAKAERREISFQMVTDDIYAVSKGRLVGTPR
ncbi:MAG: methylaspartate mutase subunit E [Kiritimatiellia bacterium]|jgi:methylaspartate mutase epsilon subunit